MKWFDPANLPPIISFLGRFGLIGMLVFASVQSWGSHPVMADGEQTLDRWRTFDQRTRGLVFRDSVDPVWIGNDDRAFWYRVPTGAKTHEFILVDVRRGERRLAFDHDRLAAAIAQHCDVRPPADRLDLKQLRFAEDLQSCYFRLENRPWRFVLPGGPLEPLDTGNKVADKSVTAGLVALARVTRSRGGSSDRAPIRFDNRLDQPLEYLWVTAGGELRSYGTVPAKATREVSTFAGHAWVLRMASGDLAAAFVADKSSSLAVIDQMTITPRPMDRRRGRSRRPRAANSPDGKWRVQFEQGDVRVVDVQSEEATQVTSDATEEESYGDRVWWAPDSSAFVVMRTRRGSDRKIHMVDSAPDDSIHANLVTVPYVKPGDPVEHPRPVLVHVDDFKPHLIDDRHFQNPYAITDLQWRDDCSSFSFVYNQRGHQVLRQISVAASDATARVVIDEASDTFICYSGKKYLRRIDETDEVIWMSERSGWNHLYLIDFRTGEVKNAITSGPWVVRGIERVDPQKRQLWLKVSGLDPQQDPYHVHALRVDFDGTNMTQLTAGDGDHEWEFSPGGGYLIDQYSRVDMPPVTELRDAQSGESVCLLETADASPLLQTGWTPPERFVAKGRDDQTDIHGIIIRPTDFDPKERYPVLEAIYAGPHSAFVPKRFGRHASLYRMAELGFIVVKIDGMGTSHRSKAFHDVCWKNLADSGFPDRIAWIKAAAVDRPEMDLSRVGIWGGSAGGQSAMRALIAHGDFYHAAVADCGCHDNRVDKRWWNEQWMGWPVGPHYREQSNVTQAHRLQGDLMLIWGELDRNVDPASTMQVVDALIKADKDFEMLIMPGVGHGAAGHPYASRRQAEFFLEKLRKN